MSAPAVVVDAGVAADMQTALADVTCGRDGVAMLVQLLQGAQANTLEHLAADGLVALLDGVRTRLDLACDGLRGTALQLGVEVPA